ncbi:hypothetical protein [Actinomadura sp. NAK00032]|uniref:hypothetical protein n=1 Tax=Actinomadura sp. NAK00032 TaxID=2742128 RepID=UPI0034A1D7A8
MPAVRARARRVESRRGRTPGEGNGYEQQRNRELPAFLRDSVRDKEQTIVMVTHDPAAAGHADEVLFLSDGTIVDRMAAPTADRVLERMKGFELPGGERS